MAKRSREGALKRAREKARQEKKEAKRDQRAARVDEPSLDPVDERSLLEEFARLSAGYEANQIAHDDYEAEKKRIFTELGIEVEE